MARHASLMIDDRGQPPDLVNGGASTTRYLGKVLQALGTGLQVGTSYCPGDAQRLRTYGPGPPDERPTVVGSRRSIR